MDISAVMLPDYVREINSQFGRNDPKENGWSYEQYVLGDPIIAAPDANLASVSGKEKLWMPISHPQQC